MNTDWQSMRDMPFHETVIAENYKGQEERVYRTNHFNGNGVQTEFNGVVDLTYFTRWRHIGK